MKHPKSGKPALAAALDRERSLMAETIHAGLSQDLCALALQVRALLRKAQHSTPSLLLPDLGELEKSVEHTIENALALAGALHPCIPSGGALIQSLRALFQSKSCDFTWDTEIEQISDSIKEETFLRFYLVAQEAARALPANGLSKLAAELRMPARCLTLRICQPKSDRLTVWDPLLRQIVQAHAACINAVIEFSFDAARGNVLECQLALP